MREKIFVESEMVKYHSGEINKKEFPVGTVVYFADWEGSRRCVKFGTVEENYTTEICVKLYDLLERRMVNGIPLDEFKTPTPWKKLPRNWTYDTELFTLTTNDPSIYGSFDITSPESIKAAIDIGFLVPVREIDYCRIEAEIDTRCGYRIIRKYPYNQTHNHPWYASVRFDKVYGKFEEAQEECKAYDKSLKTQSEMTDEEWSISLIDEDLNRWASLYEHSEAEKQECRNRILSLSNIEDVETRLLSGDIQWKYAKNKQFNTLL